MENFRPGTTLRTPLTSVDLPDPEGAEMMNTFVIRYFALARALSRYLISSPSPLRLSSKLRRPVRTSWRAACSPRDSFPGAGSPVSCRSLHPDPAVQRGVAHGWRGGQFLPAHRGDLQARRPPEGSAP